MKLKRIFPALLVLCLLVACFTLAVSAEETPRFTVAVSTNDTLDVGDTFTVDIGLTNAPPVKSLYIMPDYDANKLKLTAAKWTSEFNDLEPILKTNWNANKPGDAPAAAFEFATDLNNIPLLRVTFEVIAKGADVQIGVDSVVQGFESTDSSDPSIGNETNILGKPGESYDSIENGDFVEAVTCNHVYGNTWEMDGTAHWKLCTVCGEQTKDEAVHDWTNDCDELCDTCGQTRTVTHENKTEWSKDDDYHWYDCSKCGRADAATKAEHVYDNVCDTECNDCGHVRVAPHAYGTTLVNTDPDKHWYECELCHAKKDEADHNMTGFECGQSCEDCGYSASVNHVWNTEYSKDATGHWYECKYGCGAKKDNAVEPHNNGTYQCGAVCQICAYSAGEPQHVWKSVASYDADSHWFECEYGCGATNGKAEHTYADQCTDNLKCDTCDNVRVDAPHDWNPEWTTTDADNHYYECKLCGDKKDVATHEYTDVCDADCNVCGHERTAPHSVDPNAWSYDDDNHWNECSLCGDKTPVPHDWESVCDALCDTCGMTRVPPHKVDATKWESDENNHWNECELCGWNTPVAHEYDNVCDEICNVCAYDRVAPHDVDATAWVTDGVNHWHECKLGCGLKAQVAAHEYDDTCDDFCNVCNYEREAPHDLANVTWTDNPNFHAAVCNNPNCEIKVIERAHEYEFACDATCDTCGHVRSGVDHLIVTVYDENAHWSACTYCGMMNSEREAHVYESIGDLKICSCGLEKGHEHKLTLVPEVKATCTAEGTKAYYKCSGCSMTFADAEGKTAAGDLTIAATGHTKVTDAAVEATCAAEGKTEGSHCSVCNEVFVAQETIPAKAHTEETVAAVAPTCTETGLTEGVKCSVCGTVISGCETVDALGHSFGEWTEAVAPTATEAGKKTRTCATCGEVEEEAIPATGETEPTEPTEPAEPKNNTVVIVVVVVVAVVAVCGAGAGVFFFRKRR